MPALRSLFVAISCIATVSLVQAATPTTAAIERAMHCVHGAMTDSLLPVGVMTEQLANAALARCVDDIESAAIAVAGAAKHAAIDNARMALRAQLYEYALDVASVTNVAPAYVSDTQVSGNTLRQW